MGLAQINWNFDGCSTDECPLPILHGEAEDTDRALKTIPIRYRRAVELYWIWGDQDAELTVLGKKCAVDYRTFGNRVIDGHRLLLAELARDSEAWRMQREKSKSAVERASAVHGVLT